MSLQLELENTLQSLAGVESVLGGLVASTDGEFLASYMPDIYELDSLANFTNKLADIASALEGLGIVQKETVFNFEGIKLVIKSQKHGHLIIMCQSNVSIPLLNLSTNIVYKKVSDVLGREFSTDGNYEASTTTGSMTTSGFRRSSSQLNTQTISTAKAVSKRSLTELEGILATYIGPVAKLVVKKSIKKAGGEGYTLFSDQTGSFLDAVESKLTDASQRREFSLKAKQLLA